MADPFTPDERIHDQEVVLRHVDAVRRAKPYYEHGPEFMGDQHLTLVNDEVEAMSREELWRVYMCALMALAEVGQED